jgi:hypothetical protein
MSKTEALALQFAFRAPKREHLSETTFARESTHLQVTQRQLSFPLATNDIVLLDVGDRLFLRTKQGLRLLETYDFISQRVATCCLTWDLC